MSKRLVKIAKELNVATSTIVEHLTEKGFEVENKPTAKLNDEMYNELLREFSDFIEEKEKADAVVIGTSRGIVMKVRMQKSKQNSNLLKMLLLQLRK